MKSGFTSIALSLLAVRWLSGCTSVATVAPSGSIPRDQALRLAGITADAVGGSVRAIDPTGSMRPTFDERSLVALEPAPFETLRTGDIVVYRSRSGKEIIHRLYQQTGDTWLALGDANGLVDSEPVTRTNYRGRVAAIFYTRSCTASQ